MYRASRGAALSADRVRCPGACVASLRTRGLTISVNHTLVYYNHAENGCYFNINTPKTKAGRRIVPMIETVKNAFLREKANQEELGISCRAKVDGYTNFVFVNRFGNV